MKTTIAILVLSLPVLLTPACAMAELRAGAAVVDVTPLKFPVLVNGNMVSHSANQAVTPVNARAIVLDDGKERIGIVVVDSCMMPRPLLDEAKQLASQRTKMRPDRILISATHTHSAPASMGALGTPADPTYRPYLREKLAQALEAAEKNLEPAQVGWGVAQAPKFTAVRRWILRSDRMREDPFGNLTVRANMHAGGNWDHATGESGPEDPDLSLLSIQAKDGRPLAVLANFSMHYFGGVKPLNADYFGRFSEGLKTRLGKNLGGHPPFVGIMSHGCSGDIWRRDYTVAPDQRKDFKSIDHFSDGLIELALGAVKNIEYQADADLGMAEARLKLKYRVPDKQRLEWARRIVEATGDRLPKTREEIYAREQVILHERQSTEIVVQALRIGPFGIVTTPNETYALTGMKFKLQSPLPQTMVIELANGGDGYIPPPEQHYLGGYNTWPARSAGLEVQAEPKIVETGLQLLERVTARSRRIYQQSRGPASVAVLDAKPIAYWRLDEWAGSRAIDTSVNGNDGLYEPGIAFFLAGPRSDLFCTGDETNRSVHFAGGRMLARLPKLKDKYSVSLWFWNGMPDDAREVSGWLFSRGRDHGVSPQGDHLGVGGTAGAAGKLIFQHGSDGAKAVIGQTKLDRWTWNHVVLVRDGLAVRVYLNGNAKPEIETSRSAEPLTALSSFFYGGRSDRQSNWEGRLDEIAMFDHPLSFREIKAISAADGPSQVK